MSAELLTVEKSQVNTGLSVFDSGQFEQMWNVAGALSQSSLIPATLKGENEDVTKANCLRVVEQASRWGLSPFAVMDSASVVHGKLMWEGKLIAAAIKASIGVRLRYEYSGEGEARKVIVSGEVDALTETIEGTVADWKTTGKGSPWDKLANRDQMLAYRGARQWARRHAPEVILGVYAPDEFDEGQMVNVTNGRTPLIRETPLNPGEPKPAKTLVAPTAEMPKKESAQPDKAEPPSNIGKRKVKVVNVSKTEGDTCTRFSIILNIGATEVKAFTFSTRVGADAEFLKGRDATATIKYDAAKNTTELLEILPIEDTTEGGLV